MLIFGGRERDSVTQRIAECLGTGPKTKTELHEWFSRHILKRELDAALKELEGSGRIACEKIQTVGAPRYEYRLNKR